MINNQNLTFFTEKFSIHEMSIENQKERNCQGSRINVIIIDAEQTCYVHNIFKNQFLSLLFGIINQCHSFHGLWLYREPQSMELFL